MIPQYQSLDSDSHYPNFGIAKSSRPSTHFQPWEDIYWLHLAWYLSLSLWIRWGIHTKRCGPILLDQAKWWRRNVIRWSCYGDDDGLFGQCSYKNHNNQITSPTDILCRWSTGQLIPSIMTLTKSTQCTFQGYFDSVNDTRYWEKWQVCLRNWNIRLTTNKLPRFFVFVWRHVSSFFWKRVYNIRIRKYYLHDLNEFLEQNKLPQIDFIDID